MKNPWMSLWLSAANAWAGEFRRRQAAMVQEMARLWSGTARVPVPVRRKRVGRR